MEIPPEIYAQLPDKAWNPYKIRTGLRQLKELRTGHRERRGAKHRYDDEDFIRIYIEIEARAQLLTKGFVSRFLEHPKLRLMLADSRPVRLCLKDRRRLRRLHSEGQRESLSRYRMKFMHRPHPQWLEIQHRLEARVNELRSCPELFFLKKV